METGPAAEPKGKLKKLPAAGGDERLFRSAATARQAGGARACAAPSEVLHPRGGCAGAVGVGMSRSGRQSGQSGVCDGPSGFATRDLGQQRGGGHGVWASVTIVPHPGAETDLASTGPWLEQSTMREAPRSKCHTVVVQACHPSGDLVGARAVGKTPRVQPRNQGARWAAASAGLCPCPARQPGRGSSCPWHSRARGCSAEPWLSTALGSNVMVPLLPALCRTDPKCSPRAPCRPGGLWASGLPSLPPWGAVLALVGGRGAGAWAVGGC